MSPLNQRPEVEWDKCHHTEQRFPGVVSCVTFEEMETIDRAGDPRQGPSGLNRGNVCEVAVAKPSAVSGFIFKAACRCTTLKGSEKA